MHLERSQSWKVGERFLTDAGAPVSVQPKSRLALALEGAMGVDTALLAASIQHLTLIHICRRKGDGEEGLQESPAQTEPGFSCVAHP